jgi:hypothetical protein
MSTIALPPPGLEPGNPGAAWVCRFLLPQLNRHFQSEEPLDCLQLWPDDETEAAELTRLGHRCTMQTNLECERETFDFAFSGRFSSRAKDSPSRIRFACELYRALKPGGAALLAMGNQLCPFDLSRNGRGSGMTLREARAIFAGFDSIRVLSPIGHFAWKRAPIVIRPLGRILETFWKIAEHQPALFNSIFNPTLILWLTRK